MTPFRCPDHDELTNSTLALLPQGRAWQSHEGGIRPGTVLHGYWASVADVSAYLHQRLCALRLEFWCATQTETNDQWLAEYGLPDACDPFPDLCQKVAAIGGSTCEYLRSVAARGGWAIDCSAGCGGECGGVEPGGESCGEGLAAGSLVITVFTGASTAYVPVGAQAEAGCYEAGGALRCDPLEPLKCLLDRIVHAHLQTYFVMQD